MEPLVKADRVNRGVDKGRLEDNTAQPTKPSFLPNQTTQWLPGNGLKRENMSALLR